VSTRGRSSYSRTDIFRLIDLRNRFLQIAAILLDHAAGDDEPLDAAPLPLGNLENRVDRFLLRRVNESARVDDDDVGLGKIIRNDDVRLLAQLAEHDLAVHEIFRAAEGDHPDAAERLLRGEF
jgi:hypothetical protein